MTPVISEIVNEVVTGSSTPLQDFQHFKEWISQMKSLMRTDHALRYELANFKLYEANPGYYWPYIQKAYD